MNKTITTLLLGALTLSVSAAPAPPTGEGVPRPAVERPSRAPERGLKAPRKGTDPMKVLRRVAPAGKVLMGYQTSTMYDEPMGVYRLNDNAEQELLFVDDYTSKGYTLNQGWLRNGRLCVTAEYAPFNIVDYRFLQIDPFTGEILKNTKIDIFDPVTTFPNYLPTFWSSAYDPKTDTVYGYTAAENGQGYAFYAAPGDDPSKAECVKTPDFKEVCVSIAFNPDDDMIYGVNRNDDLVKIDPKTGNQTVVMATGMDTRYSVTGLLYVPETKKFLWSFALVDYTYGLAEIDIEKKSVTTLCEYDNFQQYSFLFMPESSLDPAPIRMPQIDEVKFNHNDCTGAINYFMPTEHFTGEAISGSLKWYAILDGEPFSQGDTEVGALLSVPYSEPLERGKHTFDLYVEQNGKRSAVNTHSMYVGYDVPNAPESVTLTETNISWTPVNRCVNNGYLDPENLKYHVYINGKEVGVSTGTSLDYTLPTDLPYASYRASVVADNMGQLSEATLSDDIRQGLPWDLEVVIEPTSRRHGRLLRFRPKRGYGLMVVQEDRQGRRHRLLRLPLEHPEPEQRLPVHSPA